jgi:hypothetical protein
MLTNDECQFLRMCKCTNFPLFALLDTTYLSKPRSTSNQDLFCTYADDAGSNNTFEQLKYFYYRFRTLTFANYPQVSTRAFRFVHFESQSVKSTHRTNNRNVIALINIERTQTGKSLDRIPSTMIICRHISGIFDDLTLPDAHEQLIVSFLNSPRLIYAYGALAHLNCYELRFKNTNPNIPIDFFRQVVSIEQLTIDNPSFIGFLPSSSSSFTFQLQRLSIQDISIRHLQGKHVPIVLPSVTTLTLANYHVQHAFRSLNSRELARCFPRLQTLLLYSRSIQHIIGRMFEYFVRLEYLTLNGITTIENEAFFNLHHLKRLDLGENIRRLDPYAFLHMNTDVLLFNRTVDFSLNDNDHFCTFAQFSPLARLTTFVQLPITSHDTCSCTLRYLYRHLDKSYMSLTPTCYSTASVFVLTQEDRICHFEQRLLECDLLPDEGITIYGQHYNVSYFYRQQSFKQRAPWSFIIRYRFYCLLLIVVLLAVLGLIVRQVRKNRHGAYRHLNYLLQRQRQRHVAHDEHIRTSPTSERIYQTSNEQFHVLPARSTRTTKV